MTPGTHDIILYRGSRYSETLELVDTDTGLAYDLTTQGPFYAEVRAGEKSPVLATITVSKTATPTDGVLNLVSDVSEDAPLGVFRWGVIDSAKQLWIVGRAEITTKIPETP